MNKNMWIIIFTVTAIVGCQDVRYPEPPENLIPKGKMVEILADAYIGNATRSKSVNNRILRAQGIRIDSIFYTKHQIDSLTFATSNAYYAANLESYTEIMREVEKLLLKKKQDIDSVLEKSTAPPRTKKNSPIQKEDSLQLTTPVQEE